MAGAAAVAAVTLDFAATRFFNQYDVTTQVETYATLEMPAYLNSSILTGAG
jgi:hypothetical protein